MLHVERSSCPLLEEMGLSDPGLNLFGSVIYGTCHRCR